MGNKERVERKLAAILAADVQGYNRLIEADEESTLTRIVLPDQRDAIRPGLVVSPYAFTNQQGQNGSIIIISHTIRRAGIFFAEERTQWGRWSEETGIITIDSGQRYTCMREEVCDPRDQLPEEEVLR